MFGESYCFFKQNFNIDIPGDVYNYYYLYFRFKDATDAFNYYRKYYDYKDVYRHIGIYNNFETYIYERDKAEKCIKELDVINNDLLNQLVFYKALGHSKKCNTILIKIKEVINRRQQFINNTSSSYFALYNSITIDIVDNPS